MMVVPQNYNGAKKFLTSDLAVQSKCNILLFCASFSLSSTVTNGMYLPEMPRGFTWAQVSFPQTAPLSKSMLQLAQPLCSYYYCKTPFSNNH